MTRGRDLQLAKYDFLASGGVTVPTVSSTVQASWVRCRDLRVDHSSLDPDFVDQPGDTVLARAARPVLKALADQLSGEPVAIILTDTSGVVIERHCSDNDLLGGLDRANLAPGFTYSEEAVGTNGIGTALETGRATMIEGPEHFSDPLAVFTCAGVPIRHPTSGQLLGVLDLTALSRISNPLLMAFAKLAAEQIRQSMLETTSLLERALLEDYFAACRHSGGPVIAVGHDITMINEGVQRRFNSADQAALLSHIRETSGADRDTTLVTDLPSGLITRLAYRPSFVADRLAGGVVRIQEVNKPAGQRPGAGQNRRITLKDAPGPSLTWQRVVEQVWQNALDRQWTRLHGEPGTGKSTLVRAAHAKLHGGRGIVVLDAATTAPDELLDSLELALTSETAVHVRHLESLPAHANDDLASVLHQALTDDRTDLAWLTVTCAGADADLSPVLIPFFSRSLTVPPLRHHGDDIPAIVAHLLTRLGRPTAIGADAMQQLMRATWPGNIAQVKEVLTVLTRERPFGTVQAADLPPECRSTARRRLSPIEVLERDAIVEALAHHDGDKTAAANALGVSRATVYRKIRDFGIVL